MHTDTKTEKQIRKDRHTDIKNEGERETKRKERDIYINLCSVYKWSSSLSGQGWGSDIFYHGSGSDFGSDREIEMKRKKIYLYLGRDA